MKPDFSVDPLHVQGSEPRLVVRESEGPRWLILAALFVAGLMFVIGYVLAPHVDSREAPSSAGDTTLTTGTNGPGGSGAAPLTAIGTVSIGGTATWYCGHGSPCTRGYGPSDMVAAIDPSTGIKRGSLVTVTHEDRAVLVRIVDVCRCLGSRVIDLTTGAFSRLAPLSAGIIRVELEVGGTLPQTDMETP